MFVICLEQPRHILKSQRTTQKVHKYIKGLMVCQKRALATLPPYRASLQLPLGPHLCSHFYSFLSLLQEHLIYSKLNLQLRAYEFEALRTDQRSLDWFLFQISFSEFTNNIFYRERWTWGGHQGTFSISLLMVNWPCCPSKKKITERNFFSIFITPFDYVLHIYIYSSYSPHTLYCFLFLPLSISLDSIDLPLMFSLCNILDRMPFSHFQWAPEFFGELNTKSFSLLATW